MESGEQPTVLIVEDESSLVEIYSRWLGDQCDVRTANSGEEALDELDETVDVVLLDRLMPGLAGGEVLERIRERDLDCRVAMVTAVEPDFDILEMGFDDYLVKPVDRGDLRDVVDRLVSRSTYADLEQEYYALVTKRATLQSTKCSDELAENQEYAELESEIAELRERLDDTLLEIGDRELVSMVRDIEVTGNEAEDV
jgi:DNA-binding response OmpR family regulator